jgi:hypothetical protein
MDKHNQEKDGLIKQLILSIGLGIAILVFMLFASGILFTGAVVTSMHGAVKDSNHKRGLQNPLKRADT